MLSYKITNKLKKKKNVPNNKFVYQNQEENHLNCCVIQILTVKCMG